MDPLTAISLASSIVQFVDFGSKLIGGAREIYCSTAQNATLEVVITEISLVFEAQFSGSFCCGVVPPQHSICSRVGSNPVGFEYCVFLRPVFVGVLNQSTAPTPRQALCT